MFTNFPHKLGHHSNAIPSHSTPSKIPFEPPWWPSWPWSRDRQRHGLERRLWWLQSPPALENLMSPTWKSLVIFGRVNDSYPNPNTIISGLANDFGESGPNPNHILTIILLVMLWWFRCSELFFSESSVCCAFLWHVVLHRRLVVFNLASFSVDETIVRPQTDIGGPKMSSRLIQAGSATRDSRDPKWKRCSWFPTTVSIDILYEICHCCG